MNKLQTVGLCLLVLATFDSSTVFGSATLPIFYESSAQTEISPVIEGFRLIVSSTNNSFEVGKVIEMTISLQNVSTNEAFVNVGTGLMFYSIAITNTNGKNIQPNEYGQRLLVPVFISTGTIKIEPGNSYVAQVRLNELFDLKKAGEYSVTVSRRVPQHAGAYKEVPVTAPPLRFQILKGAAR